MMTDVANKDKTRDKMDKDATDRMCSNEVLQCLKEIEGSEATQQYVKLMLLLKEALIDN